MGVVEHVANALPSTLKEGYFSMEYGAFRGFTLRYGRVYRLVKHHRAIQSSAHENLHAPDQSLCRQATAAASMPRRAHRRRFP